MQASGSQNIQNVQNILLDAYRNVNTQFTYHAQNMANADHFPESPDEEPYRRKVPVFTVERDAETGLDRPKISHTTDDAKPFIKEYRPGHVAADEKGYIRKPNISYNQEMTEVRAITIKGEMLQQTYKAGTTLRRTVLDLLA